MVGDEWFSFLGVLAGIAVTLLSISYITFQVKSSLWRSDPLMQVIAIRTLGEFLTPLFFALITLILYHDWRLAGLIVGIGGYVIAAVHLIMVLRRKSCLDRFDKFQALGSTVMLAEYTILLLTPNVYLVVGVLVWMLMSGSIEAWIFLDPPLISDGRKARLRQLG